MSYWMHPGRTQREVPDTDSVLDEEREDFEDVMARVNGYDSVLDNPLLKVDGEGYLVPYYRALSHSPPMGAALNELGRKMPSVLAGEVGRIHGRERDAQGSPTIADYGLVFHVFNFDSGTGMLHPGHTVAGIVGGLRIECLKALRDGHEEKLTDDERRRVQFVRAVRDGTMNDEIWSKMITLMGSYRGVVEYAAIVCFLLLHHRLMSALGMPAMKIEGWSKLVEEYEDGTRELGDDWGASRGRGLAIKFKVGDPRRDG